MYSSSGKQFYINEVAALDDGQLAIPLTWIKRNGVVYVDVHFVTPLPGDTWAIKSDEIAGIAASLFVSNYLDIMKARNGQSIPWEGKLHIHIR